MRGFFFAGRAARHQPASLLRARLKFATVQRDIEPKLLQIGSHNSERFCSNYYARRLKMRAFAIAAIITSLAVPALAQGDPAKAEANKAEEQKKKESEQIERALQGNAQEDDSRTTCQENRPVGKFTLVFLRAPVRAPTATCPVRTLRSTSQPSDASATR